MPNAKIVTRGRPDPITEHRLAALDARAEAAAAREQVDALAELLVDRGGISRADVEQIRDRARQAADDTRSEAADRRAEQGR